MAERLNTHKLTSMGLIESEIVAEKLDSRLKRDARFVFEKSIRGIGASVSIELLDESGLKREYRLIMLVDGSDGNPEMEGSKSKFFFVNRDHKKIKQSR